MTAKPETCGRCGKLLSGTRFYVGLHQPFCGLGCAVAAYNERFLIRLPPSPDDNAKEEK